MYTMNDDKAHVRLIEPGIADTRRVEIRNGITLDDTVIIGPYRSLDQLKDGKKVALSEAQKKKQEAAGEEAEKLTKGDKEGEEKGDGKAEQEEEAMTASATP
jgi:hypothetical protein